MDELDIAFGILPLSIIVLSIIFTYIHLYFQKSVYNAACQYSCFSHINVHCF